MMKWIAFAAIVATTFGGVIGCIDTNTMPVDYGAPVDAQSIVDAVNKPVQNMSAVNIKVGEFFAMETSQDIALGESYNIVGDTGATITDRVEDANRVLFSGVLHQLNLQQDGTYSKVSREGQVLCASKVQCACGECDSSSSVASANVPVLASQPMAPAFAKASAVVNSLHYKSPATLMTEAVKTAADAAPAITYHHFTTWTTHERPPALAAQRPDCSGVVGCAIDVYHVAFDIVEWDDPRGRKTHAEYAVSPNVPYLSRFLTTCQSALVNVGTDGSNVLLKQCSNVFDFQFENN